MVFNHKLPILLIITSLVKKKKLKNITLGENFPLSFPWAVVLRGSLVVFARGGFRVGWEEPILHPSVWDRATCSLPIPGVSSWDKHPPERDLRAYQLLGCSLWENVSVPLCS